MKYLIVIALLFSTSLAHAHTQCSRPVDKIWNDLGPGEVVWIGFSDSGSPIYMRADQISEGQMSRFVAFALTAQTTGRNLIVRYPEDSLQCPPSGGARDDILGIWIEGPTES